MYLTQGTSIKTALGLGIRRSLETVVGFSERNVYMSGIYDTPVLQVFYLKHITLLLYINIQECPTSLVFVFFLRIFLSNEGLKNKTSESSKLLTISKHLGAKKVEQCEKFRTNVVIKLKGNLSDMM